jgi:hypothetical protein
MLTHVSRGAASMQDKPDTSRTLTPASQEKLLRAREAMRKLTPEQQEKVKRLLARKLALEAMQRRSASRAKLNHTSEQEKKNA